MKFHYCLHLDRIDPQQLPLFLFPLLVYLFAAAACAYAYNRFPFRKKVEEAPLIIVEKVTNWKVLPLFLSKPFKDLLYLPGLTRQFLSLIIL